MFPIPEKSLAPSCVHLSRKETSDRFLFSSTKKTISHLGNIEKLHDVLGPQTTQTGWEQSKWALGSVPLSRCQWKVLFTWHLEKLTSFLKEVICSH